MAFDWSAVATAGTNLTGSIISALSQYFGNQNAIAVQQQGNMLNYDIQNRNLELQKNIADRNFGLQQQVYEDQKAYNQLVMQREDNAFQRQVADLKSAGLSPLMVSGGSPATALSTGSAPQYDGSGISNAYNGLGTAIQSLFKTKAEKEQLRGALKANIIAALGNAPTNYMDSYYKLNEQKMRLGILKSEYEYYQEHGYKPTSWKELFSDFIKGLNGNSISNPGLTYNFGQNIRDKALNYIEANPFSLPNYLTKNDSSPSAEETKTTSYYQDAKRPSIALRDTYMNKLQVANLVKLWYQPHGKNFIDNNYETLSKYYDLMPNLEKNHISKESFIRYFSSKDKYIRMILFGSN